ncbi:unnamed protein product [Eruca vesicaria subsp. sativa]|uniref:Bulb-type lectin domain-containing protein n=1 Tax=Eruca vesicaria subsp. sativa TaxID=29727 RepID=A0ABC8KG11_ERUVS|nr:unnamed protein product [Eruca vesicaria subsp. sativa]
MNNYHNSYTFSFFLVLVVFIVLGPATSIAVTVSTLSSSESLTISSNRTLVSPGGVFELGFFKPSARSRWYLGMWYKEDVERTYVWVANRDNPLYNSIGTLKISGNSLALLGQSNITIWSTNLPRGFVPNDEAAWELRLYASGCRRTKQLSCRTDNLFFQLNSRKLPDITKTATLDRGIHVKDGVLEIADV